MHRRDVVVLAGGVALSGLAGCTGTGGGSDPPGRVGDCTVTERLGDAPELPTRVDGEFERASAVLDLAWTARTQDSIAASRDAPIYYEPDAGYTFLVFALEVTNPTDGVVTVDRFNFQLNVKTPDIVDQLDAVITGLDYLEAQVRPGGTVNGNLVFQVPRDATQATLRPQEANFPDRKPVAFDPTCTDSLSVGWPTAPE